MMAPARPKKTFWSDGIKTPWGLVTYRGLIILFLGSLTPLGQGLMDKFGIQTPNGDISAIKVELAATSATVKTVEMKVDSLVVETERLKMEAERLAHRFRTGPVQPNL